jgi:flagellar motor switch protein FliM
MNMSPSLDSDFAQARPLAQHCPELTWRGPRPEEREELVKSWRRDLAQELATELGQLLAGGKLHVNIAEPETLSGEQVFERIGPIAVNALLRCGESDQTVLLSLDYATAVAFTDCSFGGEGNPPEQVPTQLPRSAALLIEEVAGSIAQVIALSSGSTENTRGDVLVRSESVTRLKPFSAKAEVILFKLTMAMGAFAEWDFQLAIQSDKLDSLLPGLDRQRAAAKRSQGRADRSGVFDALPLEIEGILSEFDLPLTRLEKLAPGDEIPLSIPDEFPMRLESEEFARAAIGSLDGRMALRLTRLTTTPRTMQGGSPS